MINDHAKQRPFAMKREANETGKQKNGQRRPKCAKLSSGEPAMPVKDIFPLSLVTPVFAKISRWRRQIDTHLVVHVRGVENDDEVVGHDEATPKNKAFLSYGPCEPNSRTQEHIPPRFSG